MCNACGLLCCGSDLLSRCGCNRCGEPDCAEVCDGCGHDVDLEGCVCDEIYDDEEWPVT